jgi:hypothetical protein
MDPAPPSIARPVYFPAPILNMRVAQTGHTPSVAGRPFFMVIGLGSFISRCCLHFMQRACILPPFSATLHICGSAGDRGPFVGHA